MSLPSLPDIYPVMTRERALDMILASIAIAELSMLGILEI